MTPKSSRTARGFPAPLSFPSELEHDQERFYVIRLTEWEAKHLRVGVGIAGKFALMRNGDGTHELVRYADA